MVTNDINANWETEIAMIWRYLTPWQKRRVLFKVHMMLLENRIKAFAVRIWLMA
jgi:intein-encoded DNA endonuclease-like protein